MKQTRNALAQPVTPRLALITLGFIALVGLIVFAAPHAWRRWDARPKSIAQQQRAVRKYLEKKSGRDDFKSSYDFSLRQAVATLQSNTVRLRAEVNLLQTNVTTLDREVRATMRESAALTETERTAKRQLTALTERLTEQQKRLATRQTELTLLESNVTALATNNTGDTARAAERLEKLRAQAATTRETLTAFQTNVLALEQQRTTADKEFTKQHSEVEARQSLLATKQAELKALQEKLRAQEKEWQAVRRESQVKEQALANLGNEFARTIRKSVKEAGSYEAIYSAIGQLLWTGERLLRSDDARTQRQGAMYMDEAAQTALHSAEDAWLAARICEAHVWPNLKRFDLPDQKTSYASEVLANCNGIFQRAGETKLVERNYRLMLERANTPRRADGIRYNLGSTLEDSGQWQAALEVYREIQDSNFVQQAQRRIAAVEKRLTSTK